MADIVRTKADLERLVGSAFIEFVTLRDDLSALYPGLTWDEVMACAADEIIDLREANQGLGGHVTRAEARSTV